MKEFNNLEEIKKYYDKETNSYIFKENGKYIDLVKFNFYLDITSNINARNIDAEDVRALNINAMNINAGDIDARNIDALNINAMNIDVRDIKAKDIEFYAFCVSYNNIKCNSIKGIRKNSFYKALDGGVIIKGEK